MRKAMCLTLAIAVGLSLPALVLAKGNGLNSITVLNAARAAGTPSFHYGNTVGTFSTYDPDLTQVYAEVVCVANASTQTYLAPGKTVYDVMLALRQEASSAGPYAYFDTTRSSAWTGGGASCTAYLKTFTWRNQSRAWRTLASAPFTVV